MKLIIERKGFDYTAELVHESSFTRFSPAVMQEFGGINPNDAYTDGGFTDETIVAAAHDWAAKWLRDHQPSEKINAIVFVGGAW